MPSRRARTPTVAARCSTSSTTTRLASDGVGRWLGRDGRRRIRRGRLPLQRGGSATRPPSPPTSSGSEARSGQQGVTGRAARTDAPACRPRARRAGLITQRSLDISDGTSCSATGLVAEDAIGVPAAPQPLPCSAVSSIRFNLATSSRISVSSPSGTSERGVGAAAERDRNASSTSTAVWSAPGSECRYLPVVAMLPWPRRSLTT